MLDADIKPQPSPQERRAILEALAAEAEDANEQSPWQRASRDLGEDYATAPPRQRRGATRA